MRICKACTNDSLCSLCNTCQGCEIELMAYEAKINVQLVPGKADARTHTARKEMERLIV